MTSLSVSGMEFHGTDGNLTLKNILEAFETLLSQVIFPSLFLESKSEADEFPNFFPNTT